MFNYSYCIHSQYIKGENQVSPKPAPLPVIIGIKNLTGYKSATSGPQCEDTNGLKKISVTASSQGNVTGLPLVAVLEYIDHSCVKPRAWNRTPLPVLMRGLIDQCQTGLFKTIIPLSLINLPLPLSSLFQSGPKAARARTQKGSG